MRKQQHTPQMTESKKNEDKDDNNHKKEMKSYVDEFLFRIDWDSECDEIDSSKNQINSICQDLLTKCIEIDSTIQPNIIDIDNHNQNSASSTFLNGFFESQQLSETEKNKRERKENEEIEMHELLRDEKKKKAAKLTRKKYLEIGKLKRKKDGNEFKIPLLNENPLSQKDIIFKESIASKNCLHQIPTLQELDPFHQFISNNNHNNNDNDNDNNLNQEQNDKHNLWNYAAPLIQYAFKNENYYDAMKENTHFKNEAHSHRIRKSLKLSIISFYPFFLFFPRFSNMTGFILF